MILEGYVADCVCVKGLRRGLVLLARFDFQACSFNHSDISPFKWIQTVDVRRAAVQNQTVT
jgi:hypothetical protein